MYLGHHAVIATPHTSAAQFAGRYHKLFPVCRAFHLERIPSRFEI
jgi:hypothetical protein